MKIVIIGGGVAGLAFGILMKKRGHEVVINERHHEIPLSGHAFMMHEHGVSILKEILENKIDVPGSHINSFILKRPNETIVKRAQLEDWQCVKRVDLINSLLSVFDTSCMYFERSFSHFIYKDGKPSGVVFENGEVEMGDLFVGSDGCNSNVRQFLFGKTNFTETKVQEILGIVNDVALIKQLNGVFTKYQDAEKGLSFGCIPLSENEAVWFNQFDSSLAKSAMLTKKDLRDFTKQALKRFPKIVHNIINATDFSNAYLWNTKDFDVLQQFHKDNVILIGDAAHLSLPFTSAGTTNALCDAETLVGCLDEYADLEKAFTVFHQKRSTLLREHLNLGRKLQTNFLQPQLIKESEMDIPLIKFAEEKSEEKVTVKKMKEEKQFEILYFTDPICSTCWTIQPQLRKLKLNYQNNINLKYHMGGLLPSWENFNRGGIQKPEDVFYHWREVFESTEMPIDASVWLNEPINSSYPPSIAFKAAQIQNSDKALFFLRRINEIVFLESRNIADINIIKSAAFESGLDTNKLIKDMEKKATALFYNDLEYAKKLNIDILPTFVFKVHGEVKEFLYGAQTYDTFEKTIYKHYPTINKPSAKNTPESLFKAFPVLTMHEFKYLSSLTDSDANKIIDDLLQVGAIKKIPTRIGVPYYSMAG